METNMKGITMCGASKDHEINLDESFVVVEIQRSALNQHGFVDELDDDGDV
jgi:hypothetical protein